LISWEIPLRPLLKWRFFSQRQHQSKSILTIIVIAAYNAAKLKADLAKVDYYFSKAIEADTTVANKVDYTRKAADYLQKVR